MVLYTYIFADMPLNLTLVWPWAEKGFNCSYPSEAFLSADFPLWQPPVVSLGCKVCARLSFSELSYQICPDHVLQAAVMLCAVVMQGMYQITFQIGGCSLVEWAMSATWIHFQ